MATQIPSETAPNPTTPSHLPTSNSHRRTGRAMTVTIVFLVISLAIEAPARKIVAARQMNAQTSREPATAPERLNSRMRSGPR